MKKTYYLYALLVVSAAAGYYVWEHWDSWQQSSFTIVNSTAAVPSTTRSTVSWHKEDKTSIGFLVEMPAEANQTTVQADSELGTKVPVQMLVAKPDANTTFGVAWEDNPPVARVNDLIPDKMIDAARDQALSATETTKVSEVRSAAQGYPSREITAKNANGGYMDTRFIYAAPRLYMLIATYTSAGASHEKDITHFFNSFQIVTSKQLPQSLPQAVTTAN
uniref:PsbP C-terminal domain-containing protein n=1 Tax=mine drainage metagenome TaxID=410659 RepID=E6PYH1_9ZZZZ